MVGVVAAPGVVGIVGQAAIQQGLPPGASALPDAPGVERIPASARALRAPPPMPPQIRGVTQVLGNPPGAPWPEPPVSTTRAGDHLALPRRLVDFLTCSVWPKCFPSLSVSPGNRDFHFHNLLIFAQI